jgi:DnaJ-like protein
VQEPYESVVDRQIRLAAERGAFDGLPGAGKPLPGLDGPDDGLWWVRGYLRREGLSTEALLPASVQLRKEIDRLDETLRPLPTEPDVREAVRELNLRIVDFLRAPTGPRVQVGRVDVETAVRRWAAGRSRSVPPGPGPAATGPAGPVNPVDRPARRSPWWRRSRRA